MQIHAYSQSEFESHPSQTLQRLEWTKDPPKTNTRKKHCDIEEIKREQT